MRCKSPHRHCGFNPHHCRHAPRQEPTSDVAGRATHSAPPALNSTNEQETSSRSLRPRGRESQSPMSINHGHHHGCHPHHKKHGHHEHWGHHKKHHGGHHRGNGHGHGGHQCREGGCFVICA